MNNQTPITVNFEPLLTMTQPPWLVVLIVKANEYYIQQTEGIISRTFRELNNQLLNWWPDKTVFLSDLYQQQLAECWNAYDSLPDLTDEKTVLAQQCLMGFYYLFKIYQPIELSIQENRATLSNDINDVKMEDMKQYLISYFESISSEQQQQVNTWIEKIMSTSDISWQEGIEALPG